MIKNAKPMLALTMSNASSITLPFGKADTAEPTAGIHSNDNYGEDTAATSFASTDKTDTTKPMTAKPIKSRHNDAVTIPFGKTGDNKALAPTTAKPKPRRPVSHSGKRLSMTQPNQKLPTAASSVPAMQKANDFDLEIYSTVRVSNAQCQKLLTDAVCLERLDDKGKPVKYFVVKTKSAFAIKSSDNTFTWICTGFNILHKKRSASGEVSVEIQVTDELGTTNKQIPIDYFSKQNLKELNHYGIDFNPGYELLVSMYLTKVANAMSMESAQQKLGFSLTKRNMTFNAYKDGIFTTHNTFGTDEEYIAALNALIHDSVPIQYILSASMSAAVMTVLNLDQHMKLRSYSINMVGKSSTAKTLTSRLAASMWTNPDDAKIFKSMHSTSNALFKHLDGRFGVPMFLDEGKVASDINTEDFLISIANEREKDRLNPDSTMKATGTWNTIVVVTSEEHIHDKNASQNGGPAVRVHNAEYFSYTVDSSHADAIEEFANNNYGVLGRMFTDWLIAHRGKLKDNYEKMKTHMRKVTSDSPNDYTERVLKNYGLTYLTAKILCKLGVKIDCEGVAEIMQEQNAMISAEYNMAQNALNAIKNYTIDHMFDEKLKVYTKKMKKEHFIGSEEIVTSVVIPVEVTRTVLVRAGFKDVRAAVKEIDSAGFLRRQGNGKRNGLVSQITINKVKDVPCYWFRFFSEEECKYEQYNHFVKDNMSNFV